MKRQIPTRHASRFTTLTDYYFADRRLVLVPIEHLGPDGVSDTFAAALTAHAGWTAARTALLNAGFGLYWRRTTELARHTATWTPPRLRHIAVLREPLAVHPYAQLLNASAWTLYASDLDPTDSHAELVAYLLAHGDRAARLGEVTMAALHNAAWWFARTDAECDAFAAAAAASGRPDADAFRALADALPWLRRLSHARLRPAPADRYRPIPGTELLVPPADQAAPQRLVDRWARVARAATDTYAATWRQADAAALDALADWLTTAAPPLLITTRGDRLLWDPAVPARLDALRSELARASGAGVRDMHADLVVVDRHTRRFLAALADPAALPAAVPETEQRGYTYMHRTRRLLAYNLDEPGIDRRHGPALPYARAMLGARAVHEWAHLAVDAGWVPLAVPAATFEHRLGALAVELDAAVARAPEHQRRAAADDLATLAGAAPTPGAALARLLLQRMSDFQANLLGARYLDEAERETYVRQNVRTLRGEYPAAKLWRMLVRYVYEFQYLRFSAVGDRRSFFLRSTWFDADFFGSGVLDEATFDALTAAVGSICDCYAVDESRFVR